MMNPDSLAEWLLWAVCSALLVLLVLGFMQLVLIAFDYLEALQHRVNHRAYRLYRKLTGKD